MAFVLYTGAQLVAHPENNVHRIEGDDPTLARSPGNKQQLFRLGSPFGASPSGRSRSLGKVNFGRAWQDCLLCTLPLKTDTLSNMLF